MEIGLDGMSTDFYSTGKCLERIFWESGLVSAMRYSLREFFINSVRSSKGKRRFG